MKRFSVDRFCVCRRKKRFPMTRKKPESQIHNNFQMSHTIAIFVDFIILVLHNSGGTCPLQTPPPPPCSYGIGCKVGKTALFHSSDQKLIIFTESRALEMTRARGISPGLNSSILKLHGPIVLQEDHLHCKKQRNVFKK